MSNKKTKEEWKETAEELSNKFFQVKDKFGKGDYISVEEDIENFKHAYSLKQEVVSGGKIAGKSLFNASKFTLSKAIPQY